MKKAMDGLSFKGGYEVAWDDATNAELVLELVKQARQFKMLYFQKLGVYDYATRAEQEQSVGNSIGVKWVDVSEGDLEEPE